MKTAALWILVVPVVLGGCATSVQRRPDVAQAATAASRADAQKPPPLEFNATNYSITTGGDRVQVVQQNVGDHLEEMPLYLHLRLALYQAQGKEWNEVMTKAGRGASTPFDWGPSVWGLLSYYRASDGIEFLLDHSSMALWFRTRMEPWACALCQLSVVKIFGGVHPRLPVCYVGSKRFLVAVTLPGRVSHDGKAFPTAQCATFLIDCQSGRVVDRTEPVIYDHNPPLVLPAEWQAKYGIQVEPVASQNAAPPHR